MPVGHAHSHRARQPRRREVDPLQLPREQRVRAIERAIRRQVRLERHRARLAAGPVEVVVQVPGMGPGIRGQQRGRIAYGTTDGGQPSRWVREALERRELERVQMEMAGRA